MTHPHDTIPVSGELSLSICARAAQPALNLATLNELALVNRRCINIVHDLLARTWISVCHTGSLLMRLAFLSWAEFVCKQKLC